MIPVVPQPEPDIFDRLVRTPGEKFLKKLNNSKPTTKQWENQDHWKHIRFQLHTAYKGICAYSALRIPRGSSNPNVDHYIPKSKRPDLAYEWSNYRLSCPLANTLKRDFQDVLDPFTLPPNWFFLDFPSLLLKPNPDIPDEDQQRVWKTIDRLKLNEEQTYVDERNTCLEVYCRGGGDFTFLKQFAPFIAHELERQKLVEDIKAIMVYGPETED